MADGFFGGLARGADWAQNREIRGERHEIEKERSVMEKERYEVEKTQRAVDDKLYNDLADLAVRHNRPQPQAQAAPERAGLMLTDEAGSEVSGIEAMGTSESVPQGGAGLAPAQAPGSKAPEERLGFSIYRNPNIMKNPQFLNDAAQLFLRAKKPEGIKWLEHGHNAQKENAITALQMAMAGDLRGAEQHFNQGGQFKVVPGSLKPAEDGKQLTMQLQDGTTHTFDPKQWMRSYLSPKEFFDLAHKEGQTTETIRHNKAIEGIQGQYRKDWADIMRENNEVKKLLAELKANKEPTEKDWQKVSVNMRALLTKQMDQTAPVDESTKKKLPNPLAEFVPDIVSKAMAAARGGTNPELALEESYINARTQLDEAERVLGPIFDRAKKAGSGWFSGESDALASMRRDVNGLITQGMDLADIRRYVRATGRDVAMFNKAYGAGAPRSGSGGGLPPRGGGKVHEPTTRAEVEALPKGARFKNPSDGEIYTKN